MGGGRVLRGIRKGIVSGYGVEGILFMGSCGGIWKRLSFSFRYGFILVIVLLIMFGF